MLPLLSRHSHVPVLHTCVNADLNGVIWDAPISLCNSYAADHTPSQYAAALTASAQLGLANYSTLGNDIGSLPLFMTSSNISIRS